MGTTIFKFTFSNFAKFNLFFINQLKGIHTFAMETISLLKWPEVSLIMSFSSRFLYTEIHIFILYSLNSIHYNIFICIASFLHNETQNIQSFHYFSKFNDWLDPQNRYQTPQ